jgi:hypothetical protein
VSLARKIPQAMSGFRIGNFLPFWNAPNKTKAKGFLVSFIFQ